MGLSWGISLAFAEVVAEQALHLQHHYGVSFGIAIIPVSFIIFLTAIYFLIKRGKNDKDAKYALSEEKIVELEKLMKSMPEK